MKMSKTSNIQQRTFNIQFIAPNEHWLLGVGCCQIKIVNILDKIVEQKKREVAQLPARLIAAGDLRDAMLEHGERRDFIAALRKPNRGDIALIAEVKKASPSMGVICKDFVQFGLA